MCLFVVYALAYWAVTGWPDIDQANRIGLFVAGSIYLPLGYSWSKYAFRFARFRFALIALGLRYEKRLVRRPNLVDIVWKAHLPRELNVARIVWVAFLAVLVVESIWSGRFERLLIGDPDELAYRLGREFAPYILFCFALPTLSLFIWLLRYFIKRMRR